MNKKCFEEGKLINVKYNKEFPIDEKEFERFTKVLKEDGLLGLLNFNLSPEYEKKIQKYNDDVSVSKFKIDDFEV